MRPFATYISICGILFSATTQAAPDPVAVSVTTGKPGHVISPTSMGVSYETDLLYPASGELAYFRPDNKPLITMFKTLGIKSLRLGGSTLDHTSKPGPHEEQIASCFDFARAAEVKVIYSVRLKDMNKKGVAENYNSEYAAQVAKQIGAEYPDVLDCFAIGNEPSYYKEWDLYSAKWKAIHDAMVAEYPEANFAGPDQNPNPQLMQNVVREFGGIPGPVVKISQHYYPFGCAYKNPRKADRPNGEPRIPFEGGASREKMLAPAAYKKYEHIHKYIAQAIAGTDITYRLTESNSYYASGLRGTSDSYAAVDYLYWWAVHKAEGINFHTGDVTSGAASCSYAAFATSENGYEAKPLAYGMKLFDLGGHGKVLPVDNSSTNLTVYATLNDATASITLINKEHGTEAKERGVQIQLDTKVDASTAQVIFLRGRNDELAGGSADVTLGGVQIQEDGMWDGQWAPLSKFGVVKGDRLEIKMPPASAAVIRVAIR